MWHPIRFSAWIQVAVAICTISLGVEPLTPLLAKPPGGGGPPPPPPATAPPYSITLLGTLGGEQSNANAINATGDIVGWSYTGVIGPHPWIHAFLNVDDGNGGRTMIDLHDRFVAENLIAPFDYDTVKGYVVQEASDVNDNGQIVGQISEYDTVVVATIGFRYTPAGTDGLGNPVPPVLDWLGNIRSLSINNNGVVAGTDYSVSPEFAVIWNGVNDITPIGATIDVENYAVGINDSGQVVGRTSNLNTRAWRYTPGVGLEDVPLRSSRSIANQPFSINALGEITVTDYDNKKRQDRACLFSDSAGTVDLGTLGGNNSYARGCNNLGDVVGDSDRTDGTRHLFLYTAELGMADLETGIVNLPATVSLSNDLGVFDLVINDKGQICGTTRDNDGAVKNQAFLLTPVP